ncbi:hypothetical protein M758_10G061000 [Ceratodon purpureus]|nr:hypothetical protein M758_10G060200 [Ceratodon purpureus]KAG0603031.1 hypothetical protein M758_10G060400 [Ceratodon purpureus]KAG0603033.1 hypothetical protein M758_10G060600 [Ceratodon purpureus]KAG0603035.1 hypothetical protein M758_10G060800 [Ceratodon purpureus]KAG0603037.1 hypothetical protein M758_10G061000 [Ceratodon purpureus]
MNLIIIHILCCVKVYLLCCLESQQAQRIRKEKDAKERTSTELAVQVCILFKFAKHV